MGLQKQVFKVEEMDFSQSEDRVPPPPPKSDVAAGGISEQELLIWAPRSLIRSKYGPHSSLWSAP